VEGVEGGKGDYRTANHLSQSARLCSESKLKASSFHKRPLKGLLNFTPQLWLPCIRVVQSLSSPFHADEKHPTLLKWNLRMDREQSYPRGLLSSYMTKRLHSFSPL
jgi:hypothetical protein